MIEKEFDVVVIGSGAGGGAAAKELSALCRDGARVAVLEWGPQFKEEAFTGQELEMASRLYFDGGGFLTKNKSMSLAFAKAYGGSTVVYTGTSLTIAPETVWRWGVPGIDHADLRRRSQKYIDENGVHLLPESLINDNNRLFRESCRTLGYKVEQFPVNLAACKGSGLCNLGCPNGGKRGTHRVQLPAAERNGATVVTNCKVGRLEDRTVFATVCAPPAHGHASAWAPGEYRLKAKVVVVAAGAVHSPALLLRSRLKAALPALGRYFTCHPALVLMGRHEQPITNYCGHPKSYYCDHFAGSHRFLLETCMYFPFIAAKNLAGFGAEHSEMMTLDRLQMILVLALDEARRENRVTVGRDGEPVVDYRMTNEVRASLRASMRASARILFQSGCKRVHVPAADRFLLDDPARIDEHLPDDAPIDGKVSVTAAHLMGGCRMGTDPATSVTDAWGQVHGLPWLYVADASLFPSSAEINPYLTIMALADRVAERVRSRARELLN